MRRAIIIVVGLAVLLGVFLYSPMGQALVWVVLFTRHIDQRTALVTDPKNYQPLARDLAILCESGFVPGERPVGAPAWAPPSLLVLEPSYVSISADSASVEFGGGFHHFGYWLSRSESSGGAEPKWTLEFYSEDAKSRILWEFTLAPDETLDFGEFVQRTLAEYERRTASGGNPRHTQERVAFLLGQDQDEMALRSINEFAAKYPSAWLEQLLSHVLFDQNSGERWATQQNGFSAWLLIAYAERGLENPERMNDFTRRALEHPVDDPPWVSYNARHRGLAMARYLYEEGFWETSAALCDALLRYEGRDYRVAELQVIKKAAEEAQASAEAEPLPAVGKYDLFDPFENVDLQRLGAASRNGRRDGE